MKQKKMQKHKRKIIKPSLRSRFQLWLYDRLNIVTLDEYLNDMDNIIETLGAIDNTFKKIDEGWKHQDRFNRYIGSILKLDPTNPYKDTKTKENKERNMYG